MQASWMQRNSDTTIMEGSAPPTARSTKTVAARYCAAGLDKAALKKNTINKTALDDINGRRSDMACTAG